MYRSKSSWASSRQSHKPNGTTNYHEVPMIVIEAPEPLGAPEIPYVDDEDQDENQDCPVREFQIDHKPLEKAKRLRRNSISFPSELNKAELDALRQKYDDKENKVSTFAQYFLI